MGVYIKGMEMPKNCDECNFSLDCPHDQHQDGYKMIDGRPNSCPMVEVLIPHGRLIDADELKQKMHCDAFDWLVLDESDVDDTQTIIESEE